jgi:hypothetical protein
MFIDQNILLQIQSGDISTGRAIELLRENMKDENDLYNHQIDNIIDIIRCGNVEKEKIVKLLNGLKDILT